MEARGLEWRKLEQVMRDGVPGEAAAPLADELSQPSGGHDDETR